MKSLTIATALIAISLGGCDLHVKKQEPVRREPVVLVKPAPSLENLDARVSSLEASRAAARKAAADRAKAAKAVREF